MNRLIDADMFGKLAPAGFYVAIRVGFAFPMVEHNRLPESWVREYGASGFVVHDPAMAWVYGNTGIARCTELGVEDNQGVLELAKNHGLNYGAVASHLDGKTGGQRSFGFFFRSDREYEPSELVVLHAALLNVHQAYSKPSKLTAAEIETLSLVKNGMLMKEIASHLGISESAIKQRLKNARQKLNAKTGPQAAATATMLGMI